MLHAKYNEASAVYRTVELQSQIENADPHSLVAMLYDELLLCIDVLTVRATKAESMLDDPQAHRARAIILSLRSGLDASAGAELAVTLEGLYAALAFELEERLAAPDPLRFAELKAGIGSLSSAWNAIADGQ
jgi:flagellar secretion chaperone FliS